MTILMTARVMSVAVVGTVVMGAGAAFAHADPTGPPGPPPPPGPGVTTEGPANPPPPGYQPAPGRRAAIDDVVPAWAPPAPPPPVWAPWLPVVWNSDLPAWGVWWNGGFIQL